MEEKRSLFNAILSGEEPGTVVARDDEARLAVIEALHPEAAIHWLAIPFEPVSSIEVLQADAPARFAQLVSYAIETTRAYCEEHPMLDKGFSIKFHVGGYETVPHAKLHILSTE
jgi:histidine triad (HIT) family protein